ncbi:hypothetical protein GCM10009827_119260 [Dactylosporangium maewongense]|uniref:Enoyl-CoA hydratase n=1 Tax=Dactylosporangium maewongense TaxID=634393 RepID=A0ABP4PHH8_9ACTN
MTVRVELSDRVYTVILDRQETRNAVDRLNARTLAFALMRIGESFPHATRSPTVPDVDQALR